MARYRRFVGIYQYQIHGVKPRLSEEEKNLCDRLIVPMVVENAYPDYQSMIFIRRTWGLTLEQMGEAFGVEWRTVRRWEMGQEKVPMSTWILIGKAGKTPDPYKTLVTMMERNRDYCPVVTLKNLDPAVVKRIAGT